MLAPSVASILDDLLVHVDRFGVADSAEQIDVLVRLARANDMTPAVIDVLTDEAAPAIVRERAIARVAADLRVLAPAAPLVAA